MKKSSVLNSKDFGARISLKRREKNLTLEALADLIGVSPAEMEQMECGVRVASIDMLVTLCNKLDVSPDYLLGGSLKMPYLFDERTR